MDMWSLKSNKVRVGLLKDKSSVPAYPPPQELINDQKGLLKKERQPIYIYI